MRSWVVYCLALVSLGPAAHACPWDCADANGQVDTVDFLQLLADWGPNPGSPCDFNGDGVVDTIDFLELLANWGPCPACGPGAGPCFEANGTPGCEDTECCEH